MRIVRFLVVLGLFAAPLIPASMAQTSSTTPQMPACDGVISIARLSEITPAGSMDKFKAAVAAHQAWYTSHGYPDLIVAAPVFERDPQTHVVSYSEREILTIHYQKPNAPDPKHDAAWDAYVQMYQGISNIKRMTVACVPLVAAPAALR